MGSPGGYSSRLIVNPPEKGSFPLDHFFECQTFTEDYQKCMVEHGNAAAYCHNLARAYLQCRMDKGLMAKEDLDTLGFAKDPVPPGVVVAPKPADLTAPPVERPDTGALAPQYGEDKSKPYIAGLRNIRRAAAHTVSGGYGSKGARGRGPHARQ